MTDKYILGRYYKIGADTNDKEEGFFVQEPDQNIWESALFDAKPQVEHGMLVSLEATPDLVKKLREIGMFQMYAGASISFFNARKNFHVECFKPNYEYISALLKELAKVPVKRHNPEITPEETQEMKK